MYVIHYEFKKGRVMIKTYTWHRDSHGLFDYETRNITIN